MASKALTLLLDIQKDVDTNYFQIPKSVKMRMPTQQMVDKFESRELNKESIQDVIAYLLSQSKGDGSDEKVSDAKEV